MGKPTKAKTPAEQLRKEKKRFENKLKARLNKRLVCHKVAKEGSGEVDNQLKSYEL